jgi:hypothetical protein
VLLLKQVKEILPVTRVRRHNAAATTKSDVETFQGVIDATGDIAQRG